MTVSSAFIWRRVHSLMGFWLVVYLFEHLLVNSQATLWLGENGKGFIQLVDLIQSIPYLQVVEVILIGIPLLIHGVWGVKRALEARTNSGRSSGDKPSLGQYGRNRAFTWQRLSSWILLVGILGHVVQMRFLDRPREARLGDEEFFCMKISFDPGLYTLAARLGFTFYTGPEIQEMLEKEALSLSEEGRRLQLEQRERQEADWLALLGGYRLEPGEVIAVSKSAGLAILLAVRDTFKSPLYCILYTLFVLAAVFHAGNGFWTFLITWGWILSYRGQKKMLPISLGSMCLLGFFGLAAIWGSYWINLRS